MKKCAIVLVHGAWHAGACWDAVVDLLAARGFAVCAPDLPGHGAQQTPLHKISLHTYVKAVLELLDGIDSKVLLVGHSMAGMIISEVAARAPQRLRGLVYVGAYLPRHNESLFDLNALNREDEAATAIERAMQLSSDKRSCTVQEDAIIPLFYPLAPPALAKQASRSFQTQATLPLAAKVNLGHADMMHVASTYIVTTQDKVLLPQHQRRMLARRSCECVLEIDADHSPFLSRPAELAELLAGLAIR